MGYMNRAFLMKQFENFADKIESIFAKITDIPSKISQLENDVYGICSTAAATAVKTVDCSGFALRVGAEITVKFTVTNTAANPSLNVNGTGAKPIYYRGVAISAGHLAANRIYIFLYNGTQYELVGDIDTNTLHNNMVGATENTAGKKGFVPAPAAGDQKKFLRGDGKWDFPENYSITVQTKEPDVVAENEIILVVE